MPIFKHHFRHCLAICLILISFNFGQTKNEENNSALLLDSAKKYIQTNIKIADSLASCSLEQAQLLNNDSLIAKSCYYLGLINYFKSKFYISSEFYKKSLKTKFGSENYTYSSSSWNNLGINYEMSDRYEDALKAYLNSLKLAELRKDSLGINQTYINLGYLNSKISRYDNAYEYLTKADKYFASKSDSLNLALIQQNLGILFRQQTQYQKAIDAYTTAANIYEKIQNDKGLLEILINRCKTRILLGEFTGAKEDLNRAAKLNKLLKDEILTGSIDLLAGEFSMHLKDYRLAEISLLSALKIFKDLNVPNQLRTVNYLMIQLYSQWGESAKLNEALENYESLTQNIFNKETTAKFAEFQTIYEEEKKEERIKNLAKELDGKNSVLTLWVLLAGVFFISSLVILLMYLNIQRKRKTLFEINIEMKNTIAGVHKLFELVNDNPSESVGTAGFAKLFDELNQLILAEKLYLKPNLSVNDLAERLNTNDKYISKAISEGTGGNFNRYINRYRINEAQILLLSPEFSRLSYDEIADKSGFNNQYTFLRQFKDFTGFTPSGFRKSAEKE